MAKQNEASSKLLDKRVVDRQMARGTLSRADFEAHLNGLPDREGESENIADRVYGSLANEGRGADGEAGGEG